ncbi:MAG TPA: hypothetical protein VFL70_01105 [Bacteroidia bacterium]|nr:hypothetical protein [Bacteroidia bacterium]
MKKINLVYLIAPTLFIFSFCSEKIIFLKSLTSHSEKITTDNMGNIYLSAGAVLNKYDNEGNYLKNFSDKNSGSISSIDASNPLKLLLFYQAFQQIVFLNNMLAPTGNPISLGELGFRQVSAACISANNGFWIFNKQNSELIKFDNNLQKIFQSRNISQLTEKVIQPVFLIEHNNNVFISDTAVGILVFDGYGTYNKTLPLKGLEQFQVLNDLLIYFQDKKLKSYNMKTLEQEEILLPDSNIIMARTEKEKLYLLKQKSVDIYQIKK